jgi:hypothetical protein
MTADDVQLVERLLDIQLSILYDLRDGKVARMHSFLDHGEALRAAGLEES